MAGRMFAHRAQQGARLHQVGPQGQQLRRFPPAGVVEVLLADQRQRWCRQHQQPMLLDRALGGVHQHQLMALRVMAAEHEHCLNPIRASSANRSSSTARTVPARNEIEKRCGSVVIGR